MNMHGMRPRSSSPRYPRGTVGWGVLAVLVLLVFQTAAPGQSTSAPESQSELGTIAGHVSVPADVKLTGPLQVLLMAPRWTTMWNADLQKRIDAYFERYRAAFVENPEFFAEVSKMAYRDSIIFTISRMQQELGPELESVVKEADENGRFEFTGVELGEYRVVVIGQQERGSLLLSESLEIRTALPQFIEIRTRIQ